MFDFDNHANDMTDLRGEVAAQRRAAYRPHWCPDCMGRTGKGSPCYEEPETEEESRDAG